MQVVKITKNKFYHLYQKPHTEDNIFNTIVFFNACQTKHWLLKHKHVLVLNEAKCELLCYQILAYPQMSRRGKLKLMVLGKLKKKAKILCQCKCLPVIYGNNKNPWVTVQVVKTWLHKINAKFKYETHKIILFFDSTNVVQCIPIIWF